MMSIVFTVRSGLPSYLINSRRTVRMGTTAFQQACKYSSAAAVATKKPAVPDPSKKTLNNDNNNNRDDEDNKISDGDTDANVITYFNVRNVADFHNPSQNIANRRHSYSQKQRLQLIKHQLTTGLSEGLKIYAKLSKMRLATLVVCTTMAGYSISPMVCQLQSPTLILAATAIGTSMCVTSANTINQLMEIEHDAKMTRTKSRVLPSGRVSVRSAWAVAVASGSLGGLMLYYGVNPMTAYLGLANILLYTAVYTPMKRHSVYNTHMGSVVGAVPPLMGWTAVNGGHIIGDSYGGLLLAGILFAWQFPHFNALSHNIRREYDRAGYQMMANVNPDKNATISLRWSLSLLPLSYLLVEQGVCTEWFLLTSTVPNAYMLYWAYRFWKDGSAGRDGNARKLFTASLFHLPAIVILMLLHKKHWFADSSTTADNSENIVAL